MSRLRDLPIRRKLVAAFALTTGGALALAVAILVAADLARAREEARAQLRAAADLIGANTSAAIAFRDPRAAAETLATLRAIPDVTDATLYDAAGSVFARYARSPGTARDAGADASHQDHGHVRIGHEIHLDGRRLGSLVLHSDLRTFYAALRRDVLVTVGVALLAFAVSLLLALRLQRVISVPLLRLAGLVQQVSREADYALRAPLDGDDEIGQLARGVNEMLETVQRRDRELAEHQRDLETQVAARTAELERINERLTTELAERARAETRLKEAHAELARHHRELEVLAEMNDRLQVCRALDEVGPILAIYGPRLFPGTTGSVHRFDADSARVEELARWGENTARPLARSDDCWALRRGRMHAVVRPGVELVCPHVGDALPAGGYLCVPLLAQGAVMGLLHLRFARTPAADGGDSVRNLEPLALSAAERISLAVASLELQARLREQSVRDPLTGLYNRRYMEESLLRESARAARGGTPMAVAMLDLDHFKAFNDRHGHEAGDALLRAVGASLQESTRSEDVACRFGGEEFTLILPGADVDAARRRAEEIRERVRTLAVRHQGRRLEPVTLSIGLAVQPQHGATPEALVGAADRALYAAKEAGRDRVEVCDAGAGADGESGSRAGGAGA